MNKEDFKPENFKAIIFDLDDTLYDCHKQLFEAAREWSLKSMINAGLDVSYDELLKKRTEIAKKFNDQNIIIRLVKSFKLGNFELEDKIIKAGVHNYYNFFSIKKPEIIPFPKVINILKEISKKCQVFILTMGVEETQRLKIKALGFDKLVKKSYYKNINNGLSKEEIIRTILKENGLAAKETIVVGDRLDGDIASANKVGCTSIYIRYGEHAHLETMNGFEIPDFELKKISELAQLLDLDI